MSSSKIELSGFARDASIVMWGSLKVLCEPTFMSEPDALPPSHHPSLCIIFTGPSYFAVFWQMAEKPPASPPRGFKKVESHYWEATRKVQNRAPVNGHTGVYASHADDCMCSMGGWPCSRDGFIWSCCGQTEKYCRCIPDKPKPKAAKDGQSKKKWIP